MSRVAACGRIVRAACAPQSHLATTHIADMDSKAYMAKLFDGGEATGPSTLGDSRSNEKESGQGDQEDADRSNS
jgi:hypothetical protein